MITIPVHEKLERGYADEDELFNDLLEEFNELFMARRDYLRTERKKGEPTAVTPEGQHLRKEIADVFLVTFGYLLYHSVDREDAEDFVLKVVLDNIDRGKYTKETEKKVKLDVLNKELLIPKLQAILEEFR